MENQTVKTLWDSAAQFPELRRPKPCLKNENSTNSNESKEKSSSDTNTNNVSSVSDVAKTSNLSVEAKEWYPPGYVNPQSNFSSPRSNTNNVSHSVQSRLSKYRQTDHEQKHGNRDENLCDMNMDFLQHIIRTLTKNPGEFDDVIYDLLEFLGPYMSNISVISKVTAIIFNQALTEQNFQYSGVRLFAVLDENCPLVRACLHNLCENELSSTANVQNLLLFYAEIFSKLNYELFGNCLLKALKSLKPNADNVKNICQTLKYTGAKLEALDQPLITEIIGQLDKIRSTIPPNMSFLVESVIKLRDSQWGQVEVVAPVVTPPIEQSYEWSDGPIFYGPDGMQLTSEESEFLTENLNDFINDDTDPDALWNPEPEMNEEIQAAFAEFIRGTNR